MTGCDDDWQWVDDPPAQMLPYVEVTVTERATAELWTPAGTVVFDVDPRPRIGFLP